MGRAGPIAELRRPDQFREINRSEMELQVAKIEDPRDKFLICSLVWLSGVLYQFLAPTGSDLSQLYFLKGGPFTQPWNDTTYD